MTLEQILNTAEALEKQLSSLEEHPSNYPKQASLLYIGDQCIENKLGYIDRKSVSSIIYNYLNNKQLPFSFYQQKLTSLFQTLSVPETTEVVEKNGLGHTLITKTIKH